MTRSKLRKTNTSSKFLGTTKLRILVSFQIFMVFVLISFLFRWQIVDHERFQAQAGDRLIKKEVSALRGDILASDGSVLSFSEPRFDIYVYKDDKHGLLAAENAGRQTREEFISKVSKVLKIQTENISEELDQNQLWVKIADKVTKEKRDEVLSIPTDKDPDVFLDGMDYLDTSIRKYPEDNLASHVIGFIGKDNLGYDIGVTGLEQYFDGLLKPQVGISTLETDSNENIIAISDNEIREARRGATIQTTIDKNIQGKVEKILRESVTRYKAKSVTVIIVNPKTGEIMSMANFPDFDPGKYEEQSDSKIFGNLAVTNPYEIGSVGKVYTMSAAVDQGKVTPSTVVIDGHEGCQEIIEQRVICTYDKKPQGPLTATDAMIKSDNLALFATAQLVGEKKLAEYLENFGLGQRTRVQLAGEDAGYIKPGDKWNEADLAAYSYGHSYFQTTMQAIMGVGTLANNGKLMEPMIVRKVIDSNGDVREYEPRVVRQVLQPKSTDIMGNMLYEVFKSNLTYEDKYQHLEKYKIGMKSGTALIPYSSLAEPEDRVGYSNEVNATYIGYDASPNHSFIMLVNLSEPQTSPKLSFNNARFLWLDIFDATKNDLGVVPMYE